MKRGLAALGLAGISILAGACSKAAPSVADENAIHVAEVAWVSDWSSGNLDKVVSHYADDAVVKIPGLPVMKGRDSIRLGLLKLLNGRGNVTLTFAPEGSAGDLLMTRTGTYSVSLGTQLQKGFYVMDFVKLADGRWLINHQTSTPATLVERPYHRRGPELFDPISGESAG
jgi:ketosteroid isomerase-like protein